MQVETGCDQIFGKEKELSLKIYDQNNNTISNSNSWVGMSQVSITSFAREWCRLVQKTTISTWMLAHNFDLRSHAIEEYVFEDVR